MHCVIAMLFVFFSCIPARATLVAIVPSRDGLVIAADSRLTFLGAQCDGAFKVMAPAHLPRTVAVVTGDSVFVAPPPGGTGDLCKYLETAPRLFDAGAVVMESLEKTGGGPVRIAEVRGACVGALERFRAAFPEGLRGYAGREIFSVVVASYDAEHSVSTLRRFVVRINSSGEAEAGDTSETRLDAQSASDVWVYGETNWVKRTVLAGAGRGFVDAATLELMKKRTPISEVTKERARDAAANVIEAAERTAEADPPPSGIGGAIHVMVVGKAARAESAPWENSKRF